MKTLTTWCGSKASPEQWPAVLQGWQSHARSLERELKQLRAEHARTEAVLQVALAADLNADLKRN